MNTASGSVTTIGGGMNNKARGEFSVVGGGGGTFPSDSNSARGNWSTVSGGQANRATGSWTTVVGGQFNSATGSGATVFGGEFNTASNLDAMVGGAQNIAAGFASTTSGGEFNRSRGQYSVVSGGGGSSSADSNAALGDWATIPGGTKNVAGGNYSFAAGRRARANHLGSFVWADSSIDADFASTADNQFLIRAAGVGIGTNSPTARLDVNGSVAIGSGTPILKAISSAAILDFPSTLAGGTSDLTITVTGATLGDVVAIGVPNGSVTATSSYFGWVSAANTVTVRYTNDAAAAQNPASGTFRAMVTQF